MKNDPVNHPAHYTGHPSGIECIQVVEHMNFCRGNAVKYIWRAGEKEKDKEIQDLEKARWYLDREIKRLKGEMQIAAYQAGAEAAGIKQPVCMRCRGDHHVSDCDQ